MDNKIFNLIDSLDEKFDIEIEEYFNLPLQYREELTTYLANVILQCCDDTGVDLYAYIRGFYNAVQKNIQEEQYEKADLFQRILDLLMKKI